MRLHPSPERGQSFSNSSAAYLFLSRPQPHNQAQAQAQAFTAHSASMIPLLHETTATRSKLLERELCRDAGNLFVSVVLQWAYVPLDSCRR